MLPRIKDITAQTQQLVSGPVFAWQHYTRKGNLWSWFLELMGLLSRREFITAKSPADELLLFHRKSPVHIWKVSNITQLVNHHIAGKSYGWTDKGFGPFNKKHNIAAMAPTGNLLYFRGKNLNWSVKDLTTVTGQQITGPVTHWKAAGLNHLAGIGTGDELVVFSGSGNSWVVKNLSNDTGLNITGSLTSWMTTNGPDQVPHIAGRTPGGDLIVFWLSSSGTWKHVNVSAITNRTVSEGPCSWQTWNGPYLVEHLACKGSSGELLVFWWSPQNNWQVVDVSRINCEKIEGIPEVYQQRDSDGENAEILAFKAEHDKLYINWWKPSSDWAPVNLSAATGEQVQEDPACWSSYSKRYHHSLEYVAAQGEDYRLLLFYFDRKPRRMVEHLIAPYEKLKRLRGVVKDILIILWDWNDPAHPRPDKTDLDNIIFGASDSAKDYFHENSNGHFSIGKIDMLGWYDARIDDHNYYQTSDPGDANQDGFENQHHVKYKEAIQIAHEEGFPFANHDTDQNGKLSIQELPIILIVPGSGGRGFWRGINEVEYPNQVPLNINGLEFDSLLEIYSTPNPSIGIYAHELGHVLLGHGDMYWEGLAPGTFMKYAPGMYSVMDAHSRGGHYDPFAKMKFGWVSPRIVLNSGWYDFTAIETSYRVWVLMDPNKGNNEYFMIENRSIAGTYDHRLPDEGLAVWHIIEDHTVYNALPCPAGMDPVVWSATQQGKQWSRLGVRMIRPVITSFDNNKALWDGSDPETGYDLLSNDPNPDHSELRWADGTASGFEIRSISAPGNVMRAHIQVPF